MGDYLALLMFPCLLVALFMGFHVAFSMMGVALVFGLVTFDTAVIFQFVQKIDAVASNFVLAAVPLFVFMGAMLERSGIAENLFEAIHLWTRRLPGGLAIGTIVMCVIFAASTGVIGATETVVGLLAIPVMMKYQYEKGLISGTICAGGSLGTIIPPSVVVVILGPVADVSVGDLFVGMIFPGLIMAGCYVAYILIRCTLKPEDGPRLPKSDDDPPLIEKLRVTLFALAPPVAMIAAVLGSIMFGFAAPTEAAALGAMGAMLLAIIYKKFSLAILNEAVQKTLKVTCMIILILLGGNMFAGVFVATGGVSVAEEIIRNANLTPWLTLAVFLGICFVAGFVLDWISVLLIFIPVFIPIIKVLGYDPVWFCVMFLVVIQTSYLTPPMAPAIFYLRGISPPEITLPHMFKGVVPFIILQLIVLVIVGWFPQLVLWLPAQLLGFR
ncbi:MAG: TRAP transporter large permease subunit [Rhodospirillaceae bacterium]|nr:TRAP transporter large permease subunit [Rhodospirillaceae bacterium]MBT5243651.1 TRAP transporter large permease subunit [Rhodospirillaceae bacterium]MBT5561969.1 TRAP transporter large permease subunit [Rhodospirillaceae bacterium]MBT6240408.1 TRAP transporter large permease subunit [Rhodospirillaceae bacterium]